MERVETTGTTDQTWDVDMNHRQCGSCRTAFILSHNNIPCPRCSHDTPSGWKSDYPVLNKPPRRIVPFGVSNGMIAEKLTEFANDVPFAPNDLKADTLIARAQQLYLPHWSVDYHINASWHAEVAFSYQVVKHVERQSGGVWRMQEEKETRNDWEPRAGHMSRPYTVHTPAVSNYERLRQAVGAFDLSAAVDYNATLINGTAISAPTSTGELARQESHQKLQEMAGQDVVKACGGERVHKMRWRDDLPQDGTWHYLLLPVVVTHYKNDKGQTSWVFLHGQTGNLAGSKQGSIGKVFRQRTLPFLILAILLVIAGFYVRITPIFMAVMVALFFGIKPLVDVNATNSKSQAQQSLW